MTEQDLNHEMQYSSDVKNRLRRIEGQVGGVLRMMDQEKGCRDVVTQLSAIRAAVDRVTMYVIGSNMEQCIRRELVEGNSADDIIQEAINMLMKSR